MIKRTLIAAGLSAALMATVLAPAGANHEFRWEPSSQQFYMRNSGTSCPGSPYLGITAGSGEPGCGYQGGAPFGELYHAGAPVASTIKVYTSQEGMPQFLDPSRNVTGNVRVVATATTNRMAVGQVRVDTTLRARLATGGTIVLGSTTEEKIVDPTNSAETDFAISYDLADSLDKTQITELTVDVDIRGWHVLTGYHRLNGQSWLTLPTFIKVPIPH